MVAALILSVVEPVLTAFSVDLMNSLKQSSATYGLLMGQNALDFLGVRGTINDIVQSGEPAFDVNKSASATGALLP